LKCFMMETTWTERIMFIWNLCPEINRINTLWYSWMGKGWRPLNWFLTSMTPSILVRRPFRISRSCCQQPHSRRLHIWNRQPIVGMILNKNCPNMTPFTKLNLNAIKKTSLTVLRLYSLWLMRKSNRFQIKILGAFMLAGFKKDVQWLWLPTFYMMAKVELEDSLVSAVLNYLIYLKLNWLTNRLRYKGELRCFYKMTIDLMNK